ncbi:YjgN family protein [Roseateles sp. P5_E7]
MSDLNAAADAAAAPSPIPGPRVLEIRFTGSGSEYFRIWSVNLLLILVTLGLYLPFAKARRIRYFYANTLVDGQALSFHGDAWKMFRGFMLMVVLMGAYTFAGRLSPTAAFIAFLILCAVWPALWRASLQFRLGNTSWRGLRMRFDAPLKQAYLACAPTYLPAMAVVAAGMLMAPEEAQPARHFTAAMGMNLAGVLAIMLLSPWSLALFKRYQHNGYRYAGQHGWVELPTGKVYLLALKTFGVALLPIAAGGVLIALFAGLARTMATGPDRALGILIVGIGGLLAYLLMFAVVMPYGAARLQDLVWNRTRSQSLAFRSALSFSSLFGLTLKNWLLTALTLSLYRPFAAVATAKLRLEAVQIASQEDPADWVAASLASHADATGEIAGDFFGIDMGL